MSDPNLTPEQKEEIVRRLRAEYMAKIRPAMERFRQAAEELRRARREPPTKEEHHD